MPRLPRLDSTLVALKRMALAATVAGLMVGALPAPAGAQEVPPPDPAPVVIVGHTQFTRLFEDVVLLPGERMERDLDVSRFGRVSLLAVAETAAPASGRVGVVTAFGPPLVPVENRLTLGLRTGTRTSGGTTLPVMGPRLVVVATNHTTQRIVFSLSVQAAQ